MAFNRKRLDTPRDLVGPDKGTKEYFENLHDNLIALVPVGGRVEWDAALAVPDGWLRADGTTVSRTTYRKLFAIYGTLHGPGNGTTTFTLPTKTDRIIKF